LLFRKEGGERRDKPDDTGRRTDNARGVDGGHFHHQALKEAARNTSDEIEFEES